MATPGRRPLRNLFDEAPTPHIAHPPQTHQREYYVATDGSFRPEGGGLGAIIETRDGTRLARVAVPDQTPDNNIAEYRAVHLGLDVLAAQAPATSRIGILVDHDVLAGSINAAVLRHSHTRTEELPTPTVPPQAANHWRGIEARIAGFADVRAARIDSDQNPAHPLANRPAAYPHLDTQQPPSKRRHSAQPPPSRARSADE